MNIQRILPAIIFLILLSNFTLSQEMLWHDPLAQGHTIYGQLDGAVGYSRLPSEAEEQVRQPVWNLSQHTAGMEIRFTTDASLVNVKYVATGNLQMPHMPATGVSGLDLYLKDAAGKLQWVRGAYSFADTVTYQFQVNLPEKVVREFKLYLPLYNGVKNMQIGVPPGSSLEIIPRSAELPIVVYGTSIAQGACASRPGMAWPAILGRDINRTIINLGFSGNGRLEPEVLKYIANTEAALYILDCLPNLVPSANWTEEEIRKRLFHAAHFLKEKHPDTPILLVEHAGYTDRLTDRERDAAVRQVNTWAKEVYRKLLSEGMTEVYYLSSENIQLDLDATVDGTHPSDWGMQQIAAAYEKILSEILTE
jgi:lysophospholipase L1-like esterase